MATDGVDQRACRRSDVGRGGQASEVPHYLAQRAVIGRHQPRHRSDPPSRPRVTTWAEAWKPTSTVQRTRSAFTPAERWHPPVCTAPIGLPQTPPEGWSLLAGLQYGCRTCRRPRPAAQDRPTRTHRSIRCSGVAAGHEPPRRGLRTPRLDRCVRELAKLARRQVRSPAWSPGRRQT